MSPIVLLMTMITMALVLGVIGSVMANTTRERQFNHDWLSGNRTARKRRPAPIQPVAATGQTGSEKTEFGQQANIRVANEPRGVPEAGEPVRLPDGRVGKVRTVSRVPGATRLHLVVAENGSTGSPTVDGYVDVPDATVHEPSRWPPDAPRPAAPPVEVSVHVSDLPRPKSVKAPGSVSLGGFSLPIVPPDGGRS